MNNKTPGLQPSEAPESAQQANSAENNAVEASRTVEENARIQPVIWSDSISYPVSRKNRLAEKKAMLESYLERLHNAAALQTDKILKESRVPKRKPQRSSLSTRRTRRTRASVSKETAKVTIPQYDSASVLLSTYRTQVIPPMQTTLFNPVSTYSFNDVSMDLILPNLERIVNDLLRQKYAFVFQKPVDPVAMKIPDYFDVVKNPMDLGTLKKRLTEGYYTRFVDFENDLNLIWSNAKLYNRAGTDVHSMAIEMESVAARKISALKRDKRIRRASIPSEVDTTLLAVEKKKKPKKKSSISRDGVTPLTWEEKSQLRLDLYQVPEDKLPSIVSILGKNSKVTQSGSEFFELDFQQIDDPTLRKLQQAVARALGSKPSRTVEEKAQSMESAKSVQNEKPYGHPGQKYASESEDSSSDDSSINITDSETEKPSDDITVPSSATEIVAKTPKSNPDGEVAEINTDAWIKSLGAAPAEKPAVQDPLFRDMATMGREKEAKSRESIERETEAELKLRRQTFMESEVFDGLTESDYSDED